MNTAPLNPKPSSTHRIRFDDCDPFGHLNNISYQRYFLRAREDHALTFYQFDIFKHTMTHQKGWVVASFQIQYLIPALLNEDVVIESALVQHSATALWVEAIMYDSKSEKVKALAWMKFTYVDIKTGRKTPHEEDFITLMEAILIKDHPALTRSFEERSIVLKGFNLQQTGRSQ
jgi:YbgC/YbaW family acyl-CoA thioester hydrolase